MDSNGSNSSDDEGLMNVNRQTFFLLASIAVVVWRNQMLALVAHVFPTRDISNRRNMDLLRSQYVATLTNDRASECLSQLRMSLSCFRNLCDTLRTRGLIKDTHHV